MAPIQISMLKDFKKRDNVLEMIRCEEYGVKQSHQIQRGSNGGQAPNQLYMSDYERKQLALKYKVYMDELKETQGRRGLLRIEESRGDTLTEQELQNQLKYFTY